MIQFNCQVYLNNYLKKNIIYKHKDNCTNLMVIFETRLSLSLILVIKNAIDILPNFNLMVISTKSNLEFLEKIFGKIYYKVEVNKAKINLKEYSEVLRSKNFWSNIKEKNVLVFQSDTLFLRNIKDNEFKDLSMLGAVCVNFHDNDKFAINGGFSLRNKNLMLELCENKVITSEIEDIFYTEQIRKYYPEILPQINDCHNFAIESYGNKLTAKGIHGTDKYYMTNNNYKEIFEYL